MRFLQTPLTLLSLLVIVLSSAHIANAKPYPRDSSAFFQHNVLEIRQCSNPCGWNGQFCCAADQACYTDSANKAQCVAAQATGVAGNGQWQYFTTTYTETDLVTVVTTYSSFVPAATPARTLAATTAPGTPQPTATAVCNANLNEVACGSICCASGQFCQYLGQCANIGGSSANEPSTVFVAPTVSSASASNFFRPTSNTILTVTSTGTATTTIPFQPPIGTDGSAITGPTPVHNNGLSGGAIAGIVIGVLAGLFLLLLLCACCCFKSALDGLLTLLGIRGRRRTETTYIEERHSHHGGGAVTGGGRRWFGTRPARVERPPKKSSGLGGVGAVAAFLGTLAVLLGLRRKARRQEDKSEYGTGSSYSYSYTTSESKRSSASRNRDLY